MGSMSDMTRLNKIVDLLIFKGKIENKHIILNETESKEIDTDFVVILSINIIV